MREIFILFSEACWVRVRAIVRAAIVAARRQAPCGAVTN